MNSPHQTRKKPAQDRSRFMVETILEAATRVFDSEGIAGTTNRIAEQAGVSIGSLYQYFPNKETILAQLALQHLRTSEHPRARAAMREHAPRTKELTAEFTAADQAALRAAIAAGLA